MKKRCQIKKYCVTSKNTALLKESIVLQERKKRIEWAEILSATNDLTRKMRESGFVPDVIFTPGLSGATFANLIKRDMQAENIPVFVGILFWRETLPKCDPIDGYEIISTSKWHVLLPKTLTKTGNKKILIVDDFIVTGDFF